MIRATVVGPVWVTKRIEGFPTGALLEVSRDRTDERLVVVDHLGCGAGDHVLVALGSAVARYLPGSTPADALVIGIVDDPRVNE